MPDQEADQGTQAHVAPPGAEQEKPVTGDRRGRSEGSRRCWFKPGVSGNPRGRPRGIRGRKTPLMLLECRRVLDQPAARDSTEMQRALRELLAEDPDAFFDLMRQIGEAARHWYD